MEGYKVLSMNGRVNIIYMELVGILERLQYIAEDGRNQDFLCGESELTYINE